MMAERRSLFAVRYCPECMGQVGEATQGHFGDCPNRDKLFAIAEMLTVPESELDAANAEIERLRAAAKLVLEADMEDRRDIAALNALEDACGFSQQGQRRIASPTESESDR